MHFICIYERVSDILKALMRVLYVNSIDKWFLDI